MRRDHDVIKRQQWVISWNRLFPEDIQSRAGDAAILQGMNKSLLVYQGGACGIYDERGRLHQGKLAWSDNAAISIAQYEMSRDDVRPFEERFFRTVGDPSRCRGFGS